MADLTIYPTDCGHSPGVAVHASLTGYTGMEVRAYDYSGHTDGLMFWEGPYNNNGDCVTDWYMASGAFHALARTVMTFDTTALSGKTWDHVHLCMMHALNDSIWGSDPDYVVRAWPIEDTHRDFADFSLDRLGSKPMVATDAAASITPLAQGVMYQSTAINEARLPINTSGYTHLGLVCEDDLNATYGSTVNVHHWYDVGETLVARRPYLLFENVVDTFTATVDGDHVDLTWADNATGEDGRYLERRVYG